MDNAVLLHIVLFFPCLLGFFVVWLFFLIALSFIKDISEQIDDIQESGMS